MFTTRAHFLQLYRSVLLMLLLMPISEKSLAQIAIPKVNLFGKNDPLEKRKYIQDFARWRTGRIFLSTRNFSFEIRSRISRQEYIQFQPNANLIMGIGGYYRRLGMEIGFKVPTSEDRTKKYGNSRILDWSTTFYGDQYVADGFLQRYKGFYVRNGRAVDSKWRSGEPYPSYPELRAFNLGGNVYYVFNHNKFSYRAAFTQMEQQIQSAGSFLVMGSTSIMNFANNGQPFIPQERLAGYNFDDFRYGRFYNLALAPGYGYTFVRDQLYISLSLFMGAGVQHQRYTLGSEITNYTRVFRKNNLRIAAGYFGETFYTGANLLLDNTSQRLQELVLAANSNSFKIFAGYRF